MKYPKQNTRDEHLVSKINFYLDSIYPIEFIKVLTCLNISSPVIVILYIILYKQVKKVIF